MIAPNVRRDLEHMASGLSPVGDGTRALAATVLTLVEVVEALRREAAEALVSIDSAPRADPEAGDG